MKSGDVLNGAYVLGERLGKSPFGETWTATATADCTAAPAGSELVIKVLSLGELPEWKGFELFEREASTLKALSHPAVPRYVDSFRHEEGGAHYLALAMERIPGRNLADEVAAGRRFSETEIEVMLAGLLLVLDYIHGLRPPIIHRDVNPKNIILRPDGSLALVDFSGVQDTVRLACRDGSTIVGTAGYAPIEQVCGRSTVRSDLYAAAATAAFLLTHRHPSDLPLRDLHPDPGAVVELSPRLAYVLDNYLQADEARRDLPPARAAAILRGELPPGTAVFPARARADVPPPARGTAWQELPSDSRVSIMDEPDLLRVFVPRPRSLPPFLAFTGGFIALWLGILALMTMTVMARGARVSFMLFLVPFWAFGLGFGKLLLGPSLTTTTLTLSKSAGLVVEERLLGRSRIRTWPFSNLGTCRVEGTDGAPAGQNARDLVLEAGYREVRFGRGLSERERRAIAASINEWVRQARA